jgi:hypothetical protein
MYTACFSLCEDELPMWGNYGGNYNGIAIGFRPTAIKDMHGRIQKITYINETTDQAFLNLAREIAVQLDSIDAQNDVFRWVNASVNAICYMTAHKHSSWSYEREIRLNFSQRILPPQPGEDKMFSVTSVTPDNKYHLWTKPFERMRDGRQIEYISLPFGNYSNGEYDYRSAIDRVLVGPKCLLSVEDVHKILITSGFSNFLVRKSDCQIR